MLRYMLMVYTGLLGYCQYWLEVRNEECRAMNEEEIDPGTENEKKSHEVCYCGGAKESNMLQCSICHRLFHPGCLKSGRPSPLTGDVYFDMTCSGCTHDGQDICTRTSVSWQQAVYLALYNLFLSGSGRKGYFRWKEDICQFIERSWSLFFPKKKRSTSWCSTIAGTLSVGCPHYFKSGQKEFREPGWWALQENVPPVEKLGSPGKDTKRRKHSSKKEVSKRKRTVQKTDTSNLGAGELQVNEELIKDGDAEMMHTSKQEDTSIESLLSTDSVTMDTESDALIDTLIGEEEKELSGMMAAPSPFMDMEDPYTFIREKNPDVPDESSSDDNMDNMSDEPESITSITSIAKSETLSRETSFKSENVKTSRTKKNVERETAAVVLQDRIVSITETQEHELLCRLNACAKAVRNNAVARRLRRKLLIRKIKRDRALPLFDLDKVISDLLTTTSKYVLAENDVIPFKSDDVESSATAESNKTFFNQRSSGAANDSVSFFTRNSRVLDRFLAAPQMLRSERPSSSTFLSRLVGVDRQTLVRPITSPYTARVLKPYIRRDYESRPLKLKLMDEIAAFPHRTDPAWRPPPSAPIDYCYVQPHHIPAVNAMCREFFWPGIDPYVMQLQLRTIALNGKECKRSSFSLLLSVSECLQYPDFSCVVLYRSFVIAFAFMVPDVKYNEAYISFILVHPEWRRAGIASYMLYHLIQTCMGKDVTLHVSATNTAMLMYQKFGFKPEEFILDFYDRYLPESSPECRHAFFLRLRR